MRRSTALFAAVGLAVVSGVEILMTAAPALASCPPDPYTYWKSGAVSYTSIGPAAGEYNAGSTAISFTYTRSTTTTASTTVSAGASFSVDVGIASIGADLKVSVTKSFASGTSVTGHLNIPAHQSGTIQPKAQFTKFTRYRTQTTPTCGSTTTNLGSLTGITKVPYFATCVGSNTCVPKP